MKKLFFIFYCFIALLLGIIFFCIEKSYFILNFPFDQKETAVVNDQVIQTKTITLYAYDQEKWKQETTEILYSNDQVNNLKLLITSWLTFLEDENIIQNNVQINSIALSSSKTEAFLSFNNNIFEKNWSIYKKLMLIEGLMKTIRENKLPILSIRILLYHQALPDDHIDFNQSLPVSGFSIKS